MNEQLEQARLAYEMIRGRCSDNHWYQTRKLLERHNLPITVANVQFFAELRKLIPRSAIDTSGLLAAYREAEEILSKTSQTFKGSEIITMLKKFGVAPHQSTISRWFRPLGGYRKNKDYSPQNFKSLFIQAFLYKAQYSTQLPEAN